MLILDILLGCFSMTDLLSQNFARELRPLAVLQLSATASQEVGPIASTLAVPTHSESSLAGKPSDREDPRGLFSTRSREGLGSANALVPEPS